MSFKRKGYNPMRKFDFECVEKTVSSESRSSFEG